MDPLSELALKYGSDKGGAHLKAGDTCHRYTEAYHELFKDRRELVRWVLEIGIAHGASLRMWRDFFPNATVFGMDCERATLFNEERIHTFLGHQADEDDLIRVVTAAGWPLTRFDLIVDDGSHKPEDQIYTAYTLMQALAHDGFYVIEDIFPDCKPELVAEPAKINNYVRWTALPTGRGLGKAHCGCGCGQGEQLVVLRWV